MRNRWRWAALACGGLMVLAGAAAWRQSEGRGPTLEPAPGESSAVSDEGRFVVHEWGTFTNFSGASGAYVDYRPLLEDDLPDFVWDRWMQSQSPLGKFFIRTRQRMETPITYFYTDRPRDVRVRVDFPQGLLTEFYPPVESMGPEFSAVEKTPLRDSYLDWGQFRIFPESHLAEMVERDEEGNIFWQAGLPEVTGDDHYGYARETDAAVVATQDVGGGRHFEKFLFYRGVGDFSLPLKLSALGGDRFEVTNFGADAVESLFLVEIAGGRTRFAYVPRLDAHAAMYVEQSSAGSSIDELAEQMVRALNAAGLYDKESRAMVNTWRSSWFGEEGTRLLYLVPRPLTDEVLPIQIEPAPDELVRVLVGRMEILTPEQADRIATEVRSLGTCATIEAEPLASELAHLGRFAEPALEYIAAQEERGTAAQIENLLTTLRESRR